MCDLFPPVSGTVANVILLLCKEAAGVDIGFDNSHKKVINNSSIG